MTVPRSWLATAQHPIDACDYKHDHRRDRIAAPGRGEHLLKSGRRMSFLLLDAIVPVFSEALNVRL